MAGEGGEFHNFPKKEIEKAIVDIDKKGINIPVLPRIETTLKFRTLTKLKKFWDFLKEDSWKSLIVTLILAFIIIKFVFFPLLSFFTGTALPLVIVESCSMYHSYGLEEVLENEIYGYNNITFEDAKSWSLKNGFSKGDVIFVIGVKKEKLKIGDVVIFSANQPNPIIHRVISIRESSFSTKGDHNSGLLESEKDIKKEQIVGKAVFRIPFIGWAKLGFFEFFKNPSERGFCK